MKLFNEPVRLWHVLLVLVGLAVPLAWAADTKISALTELTKGSLAAGDMFVVVDVSDTSMGAGGTDKKIAASSFVGPVTYKLASDYTVSSTTGTEITGIGPMTVSATGTYFVECTFLAQNATAANAADFGVNYTGTVTEMQAWITYPDTGTTATTGTADGTVTGDGGELIVAHGSVQTESTTTPNLNVITAFAAVENVWIRLNWLATVSDTGDLEIWAASEAATTLTVQSGSFCRVTFVG